MKFQYHMPTKVIIGDRCIAENAGLFKNCGKHALIVTGAQSAKKCGALGDVINVLEANRQDYDIFDKVTSNPTVDCVYDGAALARTSEADFVIAIGGGSPMDAAKVIAMLARQIMPRKKLFAGEYTDSVLPMIHVPTTAGTGSEVTPYAILTNDELKTKKSIASPALFPKFAFLDARYLTSLSQAMAAGTALDALSHAIEGMLTVRASTMSDFIAAESIRLVSTCFEPLADDTLEHTHRQRLLYASMLAGIVIANTGTTALHAMGYSLTYFKGIDHGRANGLLMGAFINFMHQHVPEKVKQILSLMNLKSVDAFSTHINRMLKHKETLDQSDIETYADIAVKAKNNANTIQSPVRSEIVQIYKNSFGL